MKILFRHGQCDHNIKNWISCGLDSKSELTDFGKLVVRESAYELKKYLEYKDNIKILASPLLRTKQTAEIICDEIGLNPESIIFDERIKEVDYGSYNEGPVSNLPYDVYDIDKFKEQGGENYEDIHKRIDSFMNEVFNDTDTFIVVSHALTIREIHKKLTGVQDKIKVGKFFIVY